MPTFKDPSATPSVTSAGERAATQGPTSKPDLVLDISEGVTQLLESRGAKTVEELRNIAALCCLHACQCCLQIRIE